MKRKVFFSVLAALTLFSAAASAQKQTATVTARYYPDPDIRFTTPTLSIEEDRLATYEEIIGWLESRTADKRVSLTYIGTSEKGRKVPMLCVSNGQGGDKVKVWFQGLLHGVEPAGCEGLCMVLDYILNDPEGGKLLDRIDLYMVPIANVDGYANNKRTSGRGIDLNRDQTKFADPQSVLLKKAFISVDPDVAVDFHEFNPAKEIMNQASPSGAWAYYDVMFLPTGYPNVVPELKEAAARLFHRPSEAALDKVGYTYYPYFTIDEDASEMTLKINAKSPQSSSTSYALSNAITFFAELRGIGLGRTSFGRRTNCAYIIARTVLEQSYDNAAEIKDIVKAANERTIMAKDPIVVAFHSKEKTMPVTFIEKGTENLITFDVKVREALEPQADLVRERPRGYVVEGEERAIENLRTLGVKVDVLTKSRKMKVESYRVTNYSRDTKKWEKIYKQHVSTETFVQKKLFPKGTYVIWLNQENANFAVSTLEPETECGFFTFSVINTSKGEILPVHRIVK